ncbi:MAG: N-acetylneuraminate synthase [Flavobacteriaceae bacterium]|nr:N-acetylneuraminate synthase [Flavobacteriaceae bacterium]|tara:strand:+ start:6203 stop:7789 length:1587 start_codon:yes stop_codon:yes gene_type:complete
MENFFNQLKNIVLASETFDRIIILGKGDSVNSIHPTTFENSFIINLNDSEKIFNGHICLFHNRWVTKSLEENGYKASHYVTIENVIDGLSYPPEKFYFVDFNNISFESFDRLITDFYKRDFCLSDFLLLSALKVSYLISQIKNKNFTIYLLGFDFKTTNKDAINNYSGHELEYKNVLFSTQKAYFKLIKRYINEKGSQKIIHVGNLNISDINIQQYNREFSNLESPPITTFDMKTAYNDLIKRVKNESYVITVAELTNNHLGNEERLRKMIRLAKKAGADMIKVQKRDVSTFYSSEELKSPYTSPFGNTLEDYRSGVELTDYLFNVLIEECNTHEIIWFASVLDYPSLKYIKKFNPVLLKIPSTISNHKNYIKRVAKEFNGDIVVSTGFTDKDYESFVLNTFLPGRNLFLLQCTSSYPAPPESCQISVIRHYEELSVIKNIPELIPGYSSHDVGNLGSMLAVSAGAKMIEKHVKLGNVDWVHFDGVALDLLEDSFKKFIKDVRKAEVLSGSKIKQIHHQEHHKYKVHS